MKRISALILSCMLFLCACSAAPAVPEAPELAEPVQAQPKTATAQREELLKAGSTPGNIALYTEAVTFVTDGTLGKCFVLPGQSVKKGDLLAELDMTATQEQLTDLLDRQEQTGYLNSLTLENLQADIDICQLKLDKLDLSHQTALAEKDLTLSTLRESLAALLQAGEAAVAAMEQELEALRAQLAALSEDPDRASELQWQITDLENRIALQRQTDADAEASTTVQIEALEAELTDLRARQALERRLYELDLADAQLARRYTAQTQSLAAEKLAGQIRLLQEKINLSTVTAPIDGTVVWISGSTKISSEDAYLYIADPNRKYLRTEEKFSDYQLTNAEAIYALVGGEKYPLTYTPLDPDERIYRTLNDIPIYTYFNFEADAQIPDSMNALFFCVHGYRENALCIPTAALYRNNAGTYVYKQVDGQRQQVFIKVGISTDLRVEVLSGLEEGDVVYVED